MNKADATVAVKQSLARGSSTPCTWRDDRDEYISEQSYALLQSLIDPINAHVVAETFSYGVMDSMDQQQVFGIARRDDYYWLLYVPATGMFSLAFGNFPGSLTLLGFASDDCLAEWLG